MLLHNSYMCKPPRCVTLWYLVLQRRLDGRLGCVYKVLLRWQLHRVVPAPAVKQVLTADVPVNYQTTITCVQNATFRHHFRTPCFSQGPPSPRPHLLLSLGVANKSFPTPPRLYTRLLPNSLIGSFCWETPTFSKRERDRESFGSRIRKTRDFPPHCFFGYCIRALVPAIALSSLASILPLERTNPQDEAATSSSPVDAIASFFV